jgi:hypothetical protein
MSLHILWFIPAATTKNPRLKPVLILGAYARGKTLASFRVEFSATCKTLLLSRTIAQCREGFLLDCAGSRAFQMRSHKSAATKPRKTIAITPFIVKNAAFNRRRSRGETRECS